MVVQLSCSSPDFPEELQQLYDQWESKKQQPTIHSLTEAFVSMLKRCQKIYLVTDALDECSSRYSPAREGMLGLIKRLVSDSSLAVNVLVLSRREQDIEESLRHVETKYVLMEQKTVDADIRVHIRKLLAEDPRLRKRPALMKEEIESSIVNGAHGM